jgi:hypothetical protein
MIPIVVLSALFVVLSLAGRLGVPFVWGWWTSLRLALGGKFLLTCFRALGQAPLG